MNPCRGAALSNTPTLKPHKNKNQKNIRTISNLQSIKQRFGIIGTSKHLDAALDTAIRVAPTELTVLITGESGVGKEAFSRIIHTLSQRKHNEFIAINCGAIPEGTINSELFGHEKGAFTGSIGERKGYFETANGGTIFLDEIGEMPMDTQAYLLRVLESGEFLKVGSSKVEKTDVRVVAATNVDLEERVAKGRFREDLFYRLNTVPIKVPALRERPGDIRLLFRKFVNDFSDTHRLEPVRLDAEAQNILENYTWPGNIRELKNVAERLSVLSTDRLINTDILLELMPSLLRRNFPAAIESQTRSEYQEKEMLYKLLFEMKADLNDLKKLIFELVHSNDLQMPSPERLQLLPSTSVSRFFQHYEENAAKEENNPSNLFTRAQNEATYSASKPIIIDTGTGTARAFAASNSTEDTPVTMEDIEKVAIEKALKKYHGRRKEAADELRISERTLYRKIKQYGIEQ